MREPPVVALVGPSPESRGGIAAMVRVVSRSPLREEYTLIPVATYRDGTRAAKAGQALRGLARLTLLLLRGRVDLIHVHTASGASLVRKSAAVFLARAARKPVVLHVHGGGFERQFGGRGIRGRLRNRLTVACLEHVDAVVVLTASREDALRKRARIRRLRVIPNAPDLPPYRGGSNGGPEQKAMILYLGHLARFKGLFELVDAVASLRATHPSLKLVLAGLGPDSDALRLHAEKVGLPSSAIEFPGWVDELQKVALLATAACLVLPSYEETLPLAVIEAMAAGVPVVATRVGGIPDAVRHEVDGLLVAPGDAEALREALGRVLDDPDLAARLSDAASRRAEEQYTAESLARRTAALYDEVLSAT